jgi:hypothetical protein
MFIKQVNTNVVQFLISKRSFGSNFNFFYGTFGMVLNIYFGFKKPFNHFHKEFKTGLI